MKKRIRRNIVFLLIFAILFANLGLAGSASASEKDPVKEAQAQETEDIAKDAENADPDIDEPAAAQTAAASGTTAETTAKNGAETTAAAGTTAAAQTAATDKAAAAAAETAAAAGTATTEAAAVTEEAAAADTGAAAAAVTAAAAATETPAAATTEAAATATTAATASTATSAAEQQKDEIEVTVPADKTSKDAKNASSETVEFTINMLGKPNYDDHGDTPLDIQPLISGVEYTLTGPGHIL